MTTDEATLALLDAQFDLGCVGCDEHPELADALCQRCLTKLVGELHYRWQSVGGSLRRWGQCEGAPREQRRLAHLAAQTARRLHHAAEILAPGEVVVFPEDWQTADLDCWHAVTLAVAALGGRMPTQPTRIQVAECLSILAQPYEPKAIA